MDPLSILASSIAVLQLTSAILSTCRNFQSSLKNSSRDLQRITDELACLQTVLQSLVKLAERQDENGSPRMQTLELLSQKPGPLSNCSAQLEALQATVEKAGSRNTLGRALTWPFQKGDVKKIVKDLGSWRSLFHFALGADHATLALRIQDGVKALQVDVTTIRGDVAAVHAGLEATVISQAETTRLLKLRKDVHKWLSVQDPSQFHNSVRETRLVETGDWLIRGDNFEKWRTDAASFLWLNGIPGCGKTVLCSTIIDDIAHHCNSDPSSILVYFYFQFDVANQHCQHDTFLRSIIKQVSTQSSQLPTPLENLYRGHRDGEQQPSTDDLAATLKKMLGKFKHVYVVADAVDECQKREKLLLPLFKKIVGWRLKCLHLLATSRKEPDIERCFTDLAAYEICAEGNLVDGDIRNYILNRIEEDPKLSRWPEMVKTIETTLMKNAHGMFRWVYCQLEALRDCKNLHVLKQTLKSLPKTLNQTYALILRNINGNNADYAHSILQFLCFSARPVTLEEVAEALTIDFSCVFSEKPRFERDLRYIDVRDILSICAGLVTMSKSTIHNDIRNVDEELDVLRLAHFSVKEYLLVSDCIRIGESQQLYSIKQGTSHDFIARTCLVYLMQFDDLNYTSWPTVYDDYPLSLYSAQYWPYHANSTGQFSDSIEQLMMELLQPEQAVYMNWNRFYEVDNDATKADMERSLDELAPPLYSMASLGMTNLSRILLDRGFSVNARGGQYGNALQAAALKGHSDVVELLLSRNADPRAWGGVHGTALHAAARKGNETIARLLIENGADVNAEGVAPGVVPSNLDPRIFQWLVPVCNIKLECGSHPSVLILAAQYGHVAVVRLLLDKEVRMGIGEGMYTSALQAAAQSGHQEVVRLLLSRGATINTPGGRFSDVLEAAAWSKKEKEVRRTLELRAGAHRIRFEEYSERHLGIAEMLWESGLGLEISP